MDDAARAAARERLASRQRNSGREVSESPMGTSPWNPPARGRRTSPSPMRFQPQPPRGHGLDGLSFLGSLVGQIDLRTKLIGVGVLAVLVLVVLGVFMLSPVAIQIDGKQVEVARSTTYQSLLDQGLLQADKGNLLSVDGELLEEGAGNPPAVYANDQSVDLGALVAEGAAIRAEQGSDAIEPYTAVQETIPIETRIARDTEAEAQGIDASSFNFYNGILHVVTDPGQEGYSETRTGEISGKTAIVGAQEMHPRVIENVHSNLPDDQKLIALTFDDGPSPNDNETLGVLAVLKKNDVKATFFMVGSEAEQYPEVAKQVADEGHQVASHSYSHAAENYLSVLDENAARDQVAHAREAIGAAAGIEPTMVRPPGGNVNVKAIEAVGTYADGYIGWSVDPTDYNRPGADYISQYIVEHAAPGAVVLLHDGGGDRSQTIEALESAIPALKKKGYEFVTIDELVEAVLANRG